MTNIRVPDWLLFFGAFINVFFFFFALERSDHLGVFLSVFCIACFIFTYRINLRERNEKEKQEKNNQRPSSR